MLRKVRAVIPKAMEDLLYIREYSKFADFEHSCFFMSTYLIRGGVLYIVMTRLCTRAFLYTSLNLRIKYKGIMILLQRHESAEGRNDGILQCLCPSEEDTDLTDM